MKGQAGPSIAANRSWDKTIKGRLGESSEQGKGCSGFRQRDRRPGTRGRQRRTMIRVRCLRGGSRGAESAHFLGALVSMPRPFLSNVSMRGSQHRRFASRLQLSTANNQSSITKRWVQHPARPAKSHQGNVQQVHRF